MLSLAEESGNAVCCPGLILHIFFVQVLLNSMHHIGISSLGRMMYMEAAVRAHLAAVADRALTLVAS